MYVDIVVTQKNVWKSACDIVFIGGCTAKTCNTRKACVPLSHYPHITHAHGIIALKSLNLDDCHS